MARAPRVAAGGVAYHVINRRAGREPIFTSEMDYAAFEKVLGETAERFPAVQIVAYCLMPNHWHLVLWPKLDGELSRFMQWLSVTHMRRWHANRGSAGTGPLYQGRFKSFPIQQDDHFLTVTRYVERNPLRAKTVQRAQDWRWSSMGRRNDGGESAPWLMTPAQWPVDPGPSWLKHVNDPQTNAELAALRDSAVRGVPFGDPAWQKRTAAKLGLLSSLRARGRPKKTVDPKLKGVSKKTA